MYIGYTPEQQALRQELRDYYGRLLTPEVEEELARGEGVGPTHKRIVRQMGRDGWLGIGWPKQYGGQGRSAIEQFVFFDESMRAGAPVPMLTINTVGPTLMNFGSDEQRQRFLPRILGGEIHFSIGYTEPGAGTDLAALQTKAVRDGDEYVINGQKIFTSLATGADYVWLAARTNPDAPKHKGISIFIVPTDTPGFKVQPMQLMGEQNTNYTFYEDVRIPATNLVGEEDGGWKLITSQLNHERVTLCSPGIVERNLAEVRRQSFATTRQLPARLASTLQAIRQHAPNARIVLLGYPDLYDLSKSGSCIGLSTQDRIALNAGADTLDTVMSAAVTKAADPRIVYADVRGQFAGHEICDPGSWLHSVDLLAISSSYHPTAAGQILGYEPVFSRNTG